MRRILLLTLVTMAACARRESGREELEQKFQQSLSGATLEGQFTVTGKPDRQEERYRIEKVSKLTGDTWLFQAQVQYGAHNVTVPIPLTVKWAGDTPVLTLTDLAIPGLGTYTARVLIYRDQYAGTWSGKTAGGTLSGRVVRAGQ